MKEIFSIAAIATIGFSQITWAHDDHFSAHDTFSSTATNHNASGMEVQKIEHNTLRTDASKNVNPSLDTQPETSSTQAVLHDHDSKSHEVKQ